MHHTHDPAAPREWITCRCGAVESRDDTKESIEHEGEVCLACAEGEAQRAEQVRDLGAILLDAAKDEGFTPMEARAGMVFAKADGLVSGLSVATDFVRERHIGNDGRYGQAVEGGVCVQVGKDGQVAALRAALREIKARRAAAIRAHRGAA